MPMVHLGIIFLSIVALLVLRRPLYQAILGGLAATALLCHMHPITAFGQAIKVFANWDSLSVLVSIYLITYLQRMLEAKNLLKLAQEDLDGLFHNRRINAAGSALFIGLLPSAAAMVLCGEIVKDATEGYLKPKEQAFVTTWFRHIPESTLPTYASVLLMANMSCVPLGDYIAAMAVPVIVLLLLGYFPYLRRIPKNPGMPGSESRWKGLAHLFLHLWMLVALLLLILACKLPVVPAVFAVLVLSGAVYRFRLQELRQMLFSAFEAELLLNTFLVLALKEFIAYAGMLEEIPRTLSSLPIPSYFVFALLFFVGGAVSGTNGIIAMGAPLAFAAMDGGVSLMVRLMCMCHAASQVSPTHVCLTVASNYFHVPLGGLIGKTLPRALAFGIFALGYYHALCALGIP